MWERMANEAMDVYSRVMMSTSGDGLNGTHLKSCT